MDSRRRTVTEFAASLAVLGIAALLPLVVTNDYWLGVLIVSMYFAMLAAAWNLLAGYTGQFSLAPAAFAMIGAYATGLLSYHFGMPPGDYVFCALQKVKDARTQGITGSATAVWWTTFHFDGEHPLALFLTADNAITWREIFPFDKK